MADLLVIGGASLDVLHFAGQTVRSAGGAGLYTAAAAARAGAATAMYAPRPDPMPEPLRPASERIAWFGPAVPPEQMPHFEIAHYGGGKAALLDAVWGAEGALDPADLPADLSRFGIVHLVALGGAARQMEFLAACRQRGARRISVGTFSRAVYGEPEIVRALLAQADLFFMNENEANGLFGAADAAHTAPGKLLFVTLGERGVRVLQGEHVTDVPGTPADELDPTGAGDTFCGATLAGLARGEHPALAARQAVALAAHMIGFPGPTALWQEGPLPPPARDGRAAPNGAQIARVAVLIAALPEVAPFDFVGPNFPPAGHPAALDYFFTAALQQFGFWELADGRYSHPLLARIDGCELKGSDYLWRAWSRPLDRDAAFYTPERQAALREDDLAALFRADAAFGLPAFGLPAGSSAASGPAASGLQPMPALDLHLAQAVAYGRDMAALGVTPAGLLAAAASSPTPLRSFLASLDHVGGYKEDPLRKKAGLLALILHQRPEHWLEPAAGELFPPVIDYHLMRSCLRIGLIDVVDPGLTQALVERRALPPADEWAVRLAAFEAVTTLVQRSGRPMGAVDWFFFNARRRCPEMAEPECARCPVDPVCAHRKTLFQPVFRTVFY